MVPLYIILIVYRHLDWALALFFLAGLSDMLDGIIARKYGQKTVLGTLLDPLADKLLLVSSFVVLASESLDIAVKIPLWLTIIVISRDIFLVISVSIFNMVIGRRGFPPSVLGKATTVSQLLLVFLVLLSNAFNIAIPVLDICIYLTATLTVGSAVQYGYRGMKVIGEDHEG